MRVLLSLLTLLGLLSVAAPAAADPPMFAIVVASCGTPPATYVVGQPYAVQMDTTGKFCTSASGGGGSSNATIVGPLGSSLSAASVAVVIASDQAAVATKAAAAGYADGWDSTEGTKSDAATCATTNTLIACTRQLHADLIAPLPAGTNAIGTILFSPVTPAAGAASSIVTGGVAVTLITGPINGCIVTNPLSAADQNIGAAEVAYINVVTTATSNGRGTNNTLQPGQSFNCIPGQTTNVSIIAATTSHAFSVTKW